MENFDLYQKVNVALDKYLQNEDFDISINVVKQYLRPNSTGLNLFKKVNKIDESENIDLIISDILDSKIQYYNDMKLNESFDPTSYKEIIDDQLKHIVENELIEQQKMLCDLYHVSLSQIDFVTGGYYNILNENESADYNIVIFKDKDLDLIKNVVANDMLTVLTSKIVETDWKQLDLSVLINAEILDILKKNIIENSDKDLNNWIVKIYPEFQFKTKKGDFYVWEHKVA